MTLLSTAFAADPWILDASGGQQQHACTAGQAVTVSGSTNHLTLTGDCGAVSVSGGNNQITIDGATRITVTGSQNQVTWSRNLSGKKVLPTSVTGIGNSVTRR